MNVLSERPAKVADLSEGNPDQALRSALQPAGKTECNPDL
jgi:hypothetical protein